MACLQQLAYQRPTAAVTPAPGFAAFSEEFRPIFGRRRRQYARGVLLERFRLDEQGAPGEAVVELPSQPAVLT